MADIFISYSKSDPEPTKQIAKYLEEKGFTVWWDTSLTAGADFREKIVAELGIAKAVIVIWTPNSVQSQWVVAEADFGRAHNKLIPLRTKDLEDKHIPMPFNTLHSGFIDNHAAIKAAVEVMGIEPSNVQINNQTIEGAETDSWCKAFEYAVEVAEKTGDISDLKDIEIQALGTPWAIRAKQERRRIEQKVELEKRQHAAELIEGYKKEGRIRIAAGCLHNDCGEWFFPGNGSTEWLQDYSWSPEMVIIPAGNCMLGSPEDEEGHDEVEGPIRQIEIAEPFAVSRFAVTVDEWGAFLASNGMDPIAENDARGDHPATNVSWIEAKAYTVWLSEKTNEQYDLLTEAQWEYCARVYRQSAFWWGSTISADQANYNASHTYGNGISGMYRGETVPVHTFRSNDFGLYNMLGNVWEWTEDCWHDNYNGAPSDGSAWLQEQNKDCERRVMRGGSWFSSPRSLRCASRVGLVHFDCDGDIGFRVCRKIKLG